VTHRSGKPINRSSESALSDQDGAISCLPLLMGVAYDLSGRASTPDTSYELRQQERSCDAYLPELMFT